MATTDARPGVWTGHLVVSGTDLSASVSFYEDIGMRKVAVHDGVALDASFAEPWHLPTSRTAFRRLRF